MNILYNKGKLFRKRENEKNVEIVNDFIDIMKQSLKKDRQVPTCRSNFKKKGL